MIVNRIGLDAAVGTEHVGEVTLALQQLEHLQPGILRSMIAVSPVTLLGFGAQRGRHLLRAVQPVLSGGPRDVSAQQANQSKAVWLFRPTDQKAQCQRLGLPLK